MKLKFLPNFNNSQCSLITLALIYIEPKVHLSFPVVHWCMRAQTDSTYKLPRFTVFLHKLSEHSP